MNEEWVTLIVKSKGENPKWDANDQVTKQDLLSCFVYPILIVAGLFLLLFAMCIPNLLNARRSAWENRCKLTLRAVGSCQAALANKQNGDYGTWDELTRTDYIQEGYNRENIIDNYTIVVYEIAKSQTNEDGEIIKKSTFTLVAIPKTQRNRLRTFAIGDDQTPRVWIGDESKWVTENVDLHDAELWEPLR